MVMKNKLNQIVKNEKGSIAVSSSILSFLVIALIIGFGETVATCYQMVSLQHAVNEGWRAGLVGDEANEELGRGDQNTAAIGVTSNVATSMISGGSNNFVSGSNPQTGEDSLALEVKIPEENSSWLVVTAKKQLTFGVLGNLVFGLGQNGKSFSLELSRGGKIQS